MSLRTGTNATTYGARTTAPLPAAGDVSFGGEVQLVTDRNTSGVLWSIAQSASIYLEARVGANGTAARAQASGTGADGADLQVGQWHEVYSVRRGSLWEIYLDGVQVAQATSATVVTPTAVAVGSNGAVFVNARFSRLRCWSAALTPAEIQAQGADPTTTVRPDDLWEYWPLSTNANGAVNGRHMTAFGSVAWEADPPVTVTPAAAAAGAGAVDPVVIRGAVTVTPESAVAAASAAAPMVLLGAAMVTPAPAAAGGGAVEPAVVRGPVALAPPAASAAASALEPTVIRGAAAIAPDAAAALAGVAAPAVVRGPVVITPAPAIAGATAAEPAIIRGGVTIAPEPAGGGACAGEPAVVRGPVSITPAPAIAGAGAVDPVALTGLIVAVVTLHARRQLALTAVRPLELTAVRNLRLSYRRD